MKNHMFLLLFFLLAFTFLSCESDYLKLMKNGLEFHIIDNDAKEGIHTKVELITPISYTKLSDNQKTIADEKYVAKMYLKAIWWYDGGNNVYNISDTLNCYFDTNFKCLRTENIHPSK